MQYTVLSSVFDTSLRQAIAAEMKRVLAPGGLIVSYDLRPVSFWLRVMRTIRYRLFVRRREPAHPLAKGSETAGGGARSEAEPQYASVAPLTEDEQRMLFSGLRPIRGAANLDFELCSYRSRERALLSDALRLSPALRSHLLL
jgi:SAM-dependent methyltransferase